MEDSNHLDAPTGNQPMSLVTIDANSKRKSHSAGQDLLTIRVLEASERKMQLIKRLLTPQEFDSIASEAFGNDHLELNIKGESRDRTTQRNDNNFSVPTKFKSIVDSFQKDNKRLSRSDTNLKFSHSNLKESLDKKREAIDFFHSQHDEKKRVDDNLAIDLRSGYYLTQIDDTKKIVREEGFSLKDRIAGLLGCIGLNLTDQVDEPAKEFIDKFDKLDCLPYSRQQNLLKMRSRLLADGHHLHLFNIGEEAAEWCQSDLSLVDLAKLHHDHAIASRENKDTHLNIPFIESVGHFNRIVLQGPHKFVDESDKILANHSDQTPEVRCLETVQDVILSKSLQSQHQLDSKEMQLSKLMNLVEPSFVLELAGKRANQCYFSLDPFEDRFVTTKGSHREALLLWRWISDSNQVIYLSEQSKTISQIQSDDFKMKLESIFKKRPEAGYRQIDALRQQAADFIKECELLIGDLLKLNHDKNGQMSITIDDLLREPQLTIDMSGALQTVREMIPKRTARRPLMPKRKSGRRLATVVQETITGPKNPDIEADAFAQWQRMSNQQSSTRLVVTIQQADNIPMRVMYRDRTRARSASPFAPSPSLGEAMMGQQPAALMTAANYLTPPTTYFEVIFQRKHQASSLVQGKSPTWNETIFFQVQESSLNEIKASTKGQLVDECLQLNLYDYHCYSLRDEDLLRTEPAELSTLALRLNTDGNLMSGDHQQASKILASRQHVERHLLGSLRVPLTTILSSGRIEGSFPLEQPILLENYQFEPAQSLTIRVDETTGSPKRQETSISLFITLDPPISVPLHLHLQTGSYESERVLEYCRLWEVLMAQYKHNLKSEQSFGRSTRTAANQRVPQTRHVRSLVMQSDAKYCVLSRLLVPMRPPDEFLERVNTTQAIARFVSLLRPLKYGLFNMRLLATSLWFNPVELLNQSLGGPEEKAVLLCNYFLYLGKCSAILLGDAIPEGRCVYVIVWNEPTRFIEDQLQLQVGSLLESISNVTQVRAQPAGAFQPVGRMNFINRLPILISSKTIQLWDPNSGRCYSLADQLSLLSLGCIATPENVYANIQSTDAARETNFDIRLKNLWSPLFESSNVGNRPALSQKRNLSRLGWRRQVTHLESLRRSIGRPHLEAIFEPASALNYEKLSKEECEELRSTIERSIKANLLGWRPNRPTYFNRTLSRLLADKLALFEASEDANWNLELTNTIKDEILAAHLVSSGASSRKIISWPINTPYSSLKSILDSLYASGVHNADLMLELSPLSQPKPTAATQFLVACHCEPFPARVVSIWLYVAVIMTESPRAG